VLELGINAHKILGFGALYILSMTTVSLASSPPPNGVKPSGGQGLISRRNALAGLTATFAALPIKDSFLAATPKTSYEVTLESAASNLDSIIQSVKTKGTGTSMQDMVKYGSELETAVGLMRAACKHQTNVIKRFNDNDKENFTKVAAKFAEAAAVLDRLVHSNPQKYPNCKFHEYKTRVFKEFASHEPLRESAMKLSPTMLNIRLSYQSSESKPYPGMAALRNETVRNYINGYKNNPERFTAEDFTNALDAVDILFDTKTRRGSMTQDANDSLKEPLYKSRAKLYADISNRPAELNADIAFIRSRMTPDQKKVFDVVLASGGITVAVK